MVCLVFGLRIFVIVVEFRYICNSGIFFSDMAEGCKTERYFPNQIKQVNGMKLTTRFLILLAIIIGFIPASLAGKSWTANEIALVKKCEDALSYRRFRPMIEAAEQLRDESLKSQNREAYDMALAFRLYGSVMAETDSVADRMVQEATATVTKSDYATKRAAAWLNAALAEYSISEIDYSRATGFALNALNGAKDLHLYDLSVVALGQLSRI